MAAATIRPQTSIHECKPVHRIRRGGMPGFIGVAGFSLIELMIVVAIVAVLAGIGYPSYLSYVQRGNRAAAQQVMLDIASRQQQYLLDARSYTTILGTSAGLNIAQQGWDCTTDNAKCSNIYYTITSTGWVSPTDSPPPTYTITATAKGSQLSDGNLTLTDTGTKTPTAKW
jgi:type IV pilus assembly protein PilE